MSAPYQITNDPHFYVSIEGGGIHTFGGTESECECIRTVMGTGNVVTRASLVASLRDAGIEVAELDVPYWPNRKELP